MRSIIISLLVILQVSSSFAKERALFYQNPTYENFIEYLINSTVDNTPVGSKQNAQELLLSVFITYVLDNHPDYRQKLSEDSAQYSKNIQALISHALTCQKTQNSSSKDCENLRGPNQNSLQFHDNSPKELMLNMSLADSYWEAFYATGNNKYLINLLKFLSDQSLEVRTISLDLIKRGAELRPMTNTGNETDVESKKSQDLVTKKFLNEWIKKNDPNGQKHLTIKIAACYSILYGMNFNLQNPNISNKVAEIIKAHPELDYTKDVKL